MLIFHHIIVVLQCPCPVNRTFPFFNLRLDFWLLFLFLFVRLVVIFFPATSILDICSTPFFYASVQFCPANAELKGYLYIKKALTLYKYFLRKMLQFILTYTRTKKWNRENKSNFRFRFSFDIRWFFFHYYYFRNQWGKNEPKLSCYWAKWFWFVSIISITTRAKICWLRLAISSHKMKTKKTKA